MTWYDDLIEEKVKSPQNGQIESPNGFKDGSKFKKSQTTSPSSKNDSQLDTLKVNKAWEVAWGPAKQIPMSLFMSWMTGNSLQMIPITQTLMLFTGALSAIMATNQQFKQFITLNNHNDVLIAKIVYVSLQFAIIAIGVYKLNSMGLIPNKRGDWLSWESPTTYIESSV